MRLKEPKFHINDVIKNEVVNHTIIKNFIHERISNNKVIRTNAYECKCNICGFISIKMESDVERRGCPCCANQVIVVGINDIPSTAPWMIPYFQGGYDEAKKYSKQSNKKINPVCPNCGRVKKNKISINNIYHKRSIGCTCNYKGKSYPERFMLSLLEQLGIEYIWQYNPTWLNGKRFDFCIKDQKLIIETDGHLGHGYYSFNKKGMDISTKYIDEWKDQKAYEHGYNVIRIDCSKSTFEYIKEKICSSELKKYFDLSKIDFSKCEKQALSNICKDVCLYYERNKNLTCKEISDIFGCGTYTITQYLKKGAEIGWCTYSVKEAKRKSIEKLALYYKKHKRHSVYDDIPVFGIKNNIYTYYNSITMAANIIGVRPNRIKAVCEHTKYHNTAGGYIWRYTDEVENNTLEIV